MSSVIIQSNLIRNRYQFIQLLMSITIVPMIIIGLTIFSYIYINQITNHFYFLIFVCIFLIIIFSLIMPLYYSLRTKIVLFEDHLILPIPYFNRKRWLSEIKFSDIKNMTKIIDEDNELLGIIIHLVNNKKISIMGGYERIEIITKITSVLSNNNIECNNMRWDDFNNNPAPMWIKKES